MPVPIPLNPNAILLEPHVGSDQIANGNVLFWKFQVTSGTGLFGFLGQNCTFEVTSDNPCNLGIYGPNPTDIGPPFGRMRSPKAGDATHHRCQGNFKPGIYYLVVRKNADNPPIGKVEIMVTTQGWQVF